jgi:hypothetical protein
MNALSKKSRAGRKKITALKIEIIRRNDAPRFWQAKITAPGFSKQITTGTVHPSAAKEFAELAYRHFARVMKKGTAK